MKIFILSLVLGLFSLETMALSCDITNYKDYIWNSELTEQLIEKTGAGCILPEADFKGANLWGADLQGAYLRGADLQGAYLWKADLRGADLQGADLEGAYARAANFERAIYNGKTDFPGWDYAFKIKHNMIEMIEEK